MNKTLNTFPFGSISMNPYTISLLSVSLCIPTNNMLENESLLEKEKNTYVQDVCWNTIYSNKNYK